MGNNGGKKNLMNLIVEGAAIPIAVNVADKMVNAIAEHKDNGERKILVPELYIKDFPIDIGQARILIEDCGLKISESKMTIKEANSKYKDCFDGQVIDSNPKQKTSVHKDAVIYVKYITQEVIDESIKKFEDEEKAKEERICRRKEKVTAVAEKAKYTINNVFKKGEPSDER